MAAGNFGGYFASRGTDFTWPTHWPRRRLRDRRRIRSDTSAARRRNCAVQRSVPIIRTFRRSTHHGPTLNSFAALDRGDQDGHAHARTEVEHHFDLSGDKTMIVHGDYLQAVASKS